MILKLSIIILAAFILTSQVSTDWIAKSICLITECCHPNDGTGYIKYESGCDTLLDSLENEVYGQPLITKPIYNSIKAHLSIENPPRPLVMYFGGWTGTGKTYVASLIAKNLYKKGMNSKFVKYITSSYHFPPKIEGTNEIIKQRNILRDMIRETVSKCPRSLIILDELDKLPSGVVDCLQPLVDYVDDIDGIKYNKAIFIFLSNTGAEKLNDLTYKMYTEGKQRKDLKSKDIEQILIKESFNEPGGLGRSALLRRYSIGVFVPFLPLERSHVKLCIEAELKALKITPPNKNELIDEIADELTYHPEDIQIYSKSGCKGVHDKVVNAIGLSDQILFSSTQNKDENLKKQSTSAININNEL